MVHEDEGGVDGPGLVEEGVQGLAAGNGVDLEMASFKDEFTDKQVIGIVVDKQNSMVFH